MAGLSGAAQLLATLTELAGGRTAAPVVRRGRYLALLAPTVGSLCLILDLHTPKRFYNMLRLIKTTSPMSLGSWALVGFGLTSAATAASQWAASFLGCSWLRRVARLTQIPAAVVGGFMGTYTASLLSATSTPSWAAVPKSLAVRFASSAIASAAASLGLGERDEERRRDLDSVAIAALTVELAATLSAEDVQRRAGIDDAPHAPNLDAIAPLVVGMAGRG